MLKEKYLTFILNLCKEYQLNQRSYKKGDIVVDIQYDKNFYVFSTGWYSVWSQSVFGGMHQVGEIDSPSVVGEGIFFGEYQKPVRIMTERGGKVYILNEDDMNRINSGHPNFSEIVMRACLAVTNERMKEANTERALGYAIMDALETKSFENIPTFLYTLKETFNLEDIIWVERHEILHDIYAVKYRESHGMQLVNERINLAGGSSNIPYTIKNHSPDIFWHVFPFISAQECFGYMIFLSKKGRLPGYITRITLDIIPNCIRLIESRWKNPRK